MSVKFQKKIDSNKDYVDLGKIDQEEFRLLNENYSKIALDNPLFKVALESITKWQQRKSKKIKTCQPIIQAYAKGLNVSEDEVYSSLLVPEIIASFNKWLPNLLGLIPGCSSLFTTDETNGGVIHTRLLDYMAGLNLVQTERALIIKNNEQNDIFGLSFAGHPIASTSAMNSKGLTLAIHYKHGNFFNTEGSSIFEICYDLLLNCNDVDDVKKHIKKYSSIAHWGIYLSDSSNTIASIDIRGNEINFESYPMEDYDYLYFNNKKMNSDNKNNNFQPYGHDIQCTMRNDSLKENIKKLKATTKHSSLECLTFIDQAQISKHWKLSPLTISTVQAYSFNNKDMSAIFIQGDAPKYFSRGFIEFENVFTSKVKQLIVEQRTSTPFENSYEYMSKAQYSIDLKDFEKAYFYMQMATAGFKGTQLESISQFYFCVLEYITNTNEKDLYYILNDFKKLSSSLPCYLKDHCHLFIFRIHKLLNEPYQLDLFLDIIKTKNLKVLLEKEHKLNIFSIKMLKKLIYPKIEIADIIYAY